MTELLNEYFGSISTGQITMGQMLLLAGAALLVFSILLALFFAIFKVKYKPDKAKDAAVQGAPPKAAKQTGQSAQTAQPARKGTDVLPRAQQPVQSGTVVLPKANQLAQNGTVVLPKANQPVQNGTVVLPKREQTARTENGTVILPKQGADIGDQVYGKEFGDTVDMQRYRQDQG